ncbi:hypothetical protein D1007_42674 [Hordeum vulgare]|uniref:Uncharacterized protein n=1 Tax=Hordeum vulgare subsp. vulgare TaxID=112509 RepID=A0A8I6Z1Y5_HORVV|nr:hypothetical protein D1007_42674 [Hordeum vulgare]
MAAARDDDIDGGGGGGGGGGGCNLRKDFWDAMPAILGALTALVIMTPVLHLLFVGSEDSAKIPEYTVAVAAFSGLDPDLDLARATLNPTFDLTFIINEPRRYSAECVERGTTASVSYHGVVLASGPVPEFCARNENVTEVGSVMAWGNAVPVPLFARERLAGELRRGDAAVDVALLGPAVARRLQRMVECTAGLGCGEASPPCKVTSQYPALPEPDEYPLWPRRARKLLLSMERIGRSLAG